MNDLLSLESFSSQEGEFFSVQPRPPTSAGPTQTLLDLVAIANQAYRAHCGHMVWACWQPAGASEPDWKQVDRIRSGTMLVMMDQPGAKMLMKELQEETFPTTSGVQT